MAAYGVASVLVGTSLKSLSKSSDALIVSRSFASIEVRLWWLSSSSFRGY